MRIYNTLSRRKEEFKPLEEGKVKMYVCGPTVYNLIHIGNARPMIVFDTVRRYFEYRGYKVKYVQNFTDVDDKMIRRAKEEGVSLKDIAEKYIKAYFEEEILGRHEKNSTNSKTMIKFLSSIIIALAIEALMLVFKFAMTSPKEIIYPICLIVAIAFLVASLGLYIYITKKAIFQK